VRDDHGGELPRDFDALHALPGIGRSTAGAILSLAAGQRHPILDGNVKRVLARVFGIDADLAERETEKRMWTLAEACTPTQSVDVYTQAVMDLGATVCTREARLPAVPAAVAMRRERHRQTGRTAAPEAPR
jgi:A/G-specific adenine glycosylase